jgi:hypothetical protein
MAEYAENGADCLELLSSINVTETKRWHQFQTRCRLENEVCVAVTGHKRAGE